VKQGYNTDPKALDLLQALMVKPDAIPNFSLCDGIMWFKGKVWIGNNAPLQQQILEAMHSSIVGGHSGFTVTYKKLQQLFAWQGMKVSAQQFFQSYSICQQAKPNRSKYQGLLAPLPIPPRAWQTVSLDFIEGLPTSGSANYILVVVDKFSKYAYFLPLHHPFTTATVARLFLDHVYKLHGMSLALISNRDRVSTSHLWKELFRLANVTLQMSSAHHPQMDGQTERVNQYLKTFLRCFVHACPTHWLKWLSLAEF
jgi:transposase InsO family protein